MNVSAHIIDHFCFANIQRNPDSLVGRGPRVAKHDSLNDSVVLYLYRAAIRRALFSPL